MTNTRQWYKFDHEHERCGLPLENQYRLKVSAGVPTLLYMTLYFMT